MKAWRNLNGNVIEIEVDQDPDGNPILPPDTTTNQKPAEMADHYLTVVDKAWVHIPVTVPFTTFETKKQEKLATLKKYVTWYLDQPVEHAGVMFDGDEQARNRLIQALVINQANGYLPPTWVTYDNTFFTLATIADLTAIINSVQAAFGARFFEMASLREQINTATTEAALEAIVLPTNNSMF